MGALLAFASAPVHAQITCSGSWLGGTGFRGLGQGHLPFPPNVRCAVAWDPDGAGSEPERLVVGGFFAIAGRTPAAMVAMWDGAHWKPLGVAGMSDEVRALAVPLAYSELLFTFRSHVDMVRAKIAARRGAA